MWGSPFLAAAAFQAARPAECRLRALPAPQNPVPRIEIALSPCAFPRRTLSADVGAKLAAGDRFWRDGSGASRRNQSQNSIFNATCTVLFPEIVVIWPKVAEPN